MAGQLEQRLIDAIRAAGPKPSDDAPPRTKGGYNQRLSDQLAQAVSEELRSRGMSGSLPAHPNAHGTRSGAERRLSGGIGAKKVDVSWATEESGLIFAVSIKTIMFRDGQSGAFQKNLTNRRADMLNEAVTLHRRFPYSVLAAFFFFDIGAETDNLKVDGLAKNRKSTFENAFHRLRLFTGREDPAGRDEQFEKFFLFLLDSDQANPSIRMYEANDPVNQVDPDEALDEMMFLVGERNFDLYEELDGKIRKQR